jgi:glycogen synthase
MSRRHARTRPPNSVVLYSRMWRAGTGLYAQGVAKGIAGALAAAGRPASSLLFIAPTADEEDTLAGMCRRRPVREFVEEAPVPRRARALRSLRRIVAGQMALLASRLRTRNMIVTIPEPMVAWLPLLALLRLTGARVVFVCHDPLPHAWRLPPRWRVIEHGAIALQYRLAWRIVVLARSAGQTLTSHFGVSQKKISCIAHGAFPAQSAGPIPGRQRLLVFGTIRANKQVHLAIEAVAIARARGLAVDLTIAGGADPNDREYVDLCQAKAIALGDAVRLEIGYIDEDRIPALMAECDALLLPYRDFASQSGVAVLAGIAGRPVICAPMGGIPDLIEAGLAAVNIAPPAGADEIADAIVSFFETPAATWTGRSETGRAKLTAALDWTGVGRRFLEIFE